MSQPLLYSLYIFGRSTKCLYTHVWHGRTNMKKIDNEKLIYGLIFALKGVMMDLNPDPPQQPRSEDGLQSFTCDKYKFHFFETPTGYKFVLMTDPSLGDMSPLLARLYANEFVEYVIKNPLYEIGEEIQNCVFDEKVKAAAKSWLSK